MSAIPEATAAAMGKRAGETFRDTGIPVRNPLQKGPKDLAAAWRRAYMAAAKPRRRK